jgi:hypothetical protein
MSDEKELLKQIRSDYDGFSSDGVTRAYNLFSTLLFLGYREFNNYWTESGSNGLIRKFLNARKLTAEEFSGLKTTLNFARSPGKTGSAPPKGFLYQAGYLTLRKDSRGACTLDYPNFEVRPALSSLFMDNLCPSEDIGDEVRLNWTDIRPQAMPLI